jgi:hypothetical protein
VALTLARALADAHGGRIEVRGAGTDALLCRLVLPLVAA